MKKQNKEPGQPGPPQQRAEELKLLHELQVHQVELEMQNEELQLAVQKAETATALYDFAPTGYFTLDSDGTISQLNFSGASMLGLERSALINRKFGLFISPDARHTFNDFLLKVFETNSKVTCEIGLSIKKGPSIYVHLEGIISENRQKCHVVAVDITERKQVEEQLQESEKRFRSLFDNATIGLYRTSPDGRILMANPTAVRLVGFNSFDELAQRNLEEEGFEPASPRSQFHQLIEQEGEVRGLESAWTRKDGSVVFVRESAKAFRGADGAISYYEGTIEDITGWRKAGEALKESEARLVELNATKDKFFSIIAHDMKGPFNSIMGFSNLLSRQIQEKDYAGIAKYATIIQRASLRAMDLLMNLLEWSRSQNGKIEFNPETIDISALINEVTTLLSPAAQQKYITIDTENPGKAMAFADRAMMGTILRNLISNAIKFTYPDGRIIVSVEEKHDGLTVTVADNGVGIAKDAIDKLFRIDASYKTIGTKNERGTGLGLLLCKEFVDRHGGKIWAESDNGTPQGSRGSKFRFTIPKN